MHLSHNYTIMQKQLEFWQKDINNFVSYIIKPERNFGIGERNID